MLRPRFSLLVVTLVLATCMLRAAPYARAQASQASTYTLYARGTLLSDALQKLVGLTQIDLVYNAEGVAGKRVYCVGRDATVERLLECLLRGSGLDYVRTSSGTYVVIDAVEEAPRYGSLAGRVVDAATGGPLPAANVLLADASAGTTSDGDGLFAFGSILEGRHRLVVTYVGYETAVVDSVRIRPGATSQMQVVLHPGTVALDPVVIDGLVQRLPSRSLGSGTLESRSLRVEAGTPDVARGASRISGVAISQPLADLHIQGSEMGEHLTMLDGAPVRDPVSLGRYLSAFSPLAVGRVTVRKAGFGAEHGSHLAGVIEVDQAVEGAPRPSAALSVDPVSLNAKIHSDLPLSGQATGTAMAALRTSVWDVFRDPGTNDLLRRWSAVDPLFASVWTDATIRTDALDERHDAHVSFSDLHAALRLHLDPLRSVAASGYRATNRIRSSMTAAQPLEHATTQLLTTDDDYEWTNWAGQVRYTRLVGARALGRIQILGSHHASGYDYHAGQDRLPSGDTDPTTHPSYDAASGSPASSEAHTIGEVTFKAEMSYSFSPSLHATTGFDLTYVSSAIHLGNPFIAPLQHEDGETIPSAFVTARVGLGVRTTLEPGLRLTYLPARHTTYAEPRLALRYDRETSRVGAFALRLAGGLYRQFINQYELTSAGTTAIVPSILFWLPVDHSVAPPAALHLAADVLLMPHPRWTLSLAGYAKRQTSLLSFDYSSLVGAPPLPQTSAQDAFAAPGRGYAWGGTARLSYESVPVHVAATYGFSRVRRRWAGRFRGSSVQPSWAQPHEASLDVRAPLNRFLTVEAEWTSTWGRRWGLRRGYYDYLAFRPYVLPPSTVDLSRPDTHPLPPIHSLDAGLVVRHTWRSIALHAQVFLVNVLNRRNVYDRSLQLDGRGIEPIDRLLPRRHPAFTLRITY